MVKLTWWVSGSKCGLIWAKEFGTAGWIIIHPPPLPKEKRGCPLTTSKKMGKGKKKVLLLKQCFSIKFQVEWKKINFLETFSFFLSISEMLNLELEWKLFPILLHAYWKTFCWGWFWHVDVLKSWLVID